jgi:hypothetical protein
MSMAFTRQEREAFLADVHVGVLSIPNGERGPLSCPIWYSYEPGGDIRVVTEAGSRKVLLIEPGTRVSFCAQQEALPPKYVSVEGPVVSVEPASLEFVREMAVRYLGPDIGAQYVEATRADREGGDQKDVVLRIRPERWLSADFAKRFQA